MKKPSDNFITLDFGATTAPYSPSSPHNGTDFSYIPDDKIYAPFAGKVSQIPNNGKDGNGTYMTDPQGRFHGLLHADHYLVPNGTNVAEGQAIAVMGTSGFTQGKHLHWAVKENNIFIDPMSLIGGSVDNSKPTSTQVGEEFQALAEKQPRQDEVDLFIGLNWFDGQKQYLWPIVAETQQKVRNLENDRDNNLYPTINATTEALGLPVGASKTDIVAAIDKLKADGVTSVLINGVKYKEE